MVVLMKSMIKRHPYPSNKQVLRRFLNFTRLNGYQKLILHCILSLKTWRIIVYNETAKGRSHEIEKRPYSINLYINANMLVAMFVLH